MEFECLHCGRCCVNICTQINITLGDIKRISDFVERPVESLFEKHIGIVPFGDPESENTYDFEIGLKIPCNFRVNNRCEIYEARPLNCRLFPYWVLANAPKEEIKNIIDSTHKCIVDFELDEKEKPKYKEFLKRISKILLEESEKTDNFIEKNNFKDSVKIPITDSDNEEKIKMCNSFIDKDKYKNLAPLAKQEISKNSFVSLDNIKEIQKVLD